MIEEIKTAADNLKKRKEISEEEYELLCKFAVFGANKGAQQGVKALWGKFLGSGGGKKAPDIIVKGMKSQSPAIAKINKGDLMQFAVLGAGALAGKEVIVDPLIQSMKIKNSYDLMTKKVPQLAEKDQEQLKDYFNVIKTFSPRTASNPLVAGHLVNKMIEFGGVDHKLVQDIAAIESGFTPTRIIQTALEAGAKAAAGAPGKEG